MTKAEIRKEFIVKRRQLPQEKVQEWSEKIEERAFNLILEQNVGVIALYAAFRNEPELWSLSERLFSMEKTVLFPKCQANGQMTMYAIHSLSELASGAYGILEPTEAEPALPEEIDLILCPGCAFSKGGERMGYGGGYYDRYLLKCTKAVKVGVCYDISLTETLPTEPFDAKMNTIITENRLINIL